MARHYWRAHYANGLTLAMLAIDQRDAYTHACRFNTDHAVTKIEDLGSDPEKVHDLGKFVYGAA